MLKNKKKLRRLERNTPGYAARTAQTLVLAGALVGALTLGGAAVASAAVTALEGDIAQSYTGGAGDQALTQTGANTKGHDISLSGGAGWFLRPTSDSGTTNTPVLTISGGSKVTLDGNVNPTSRTGIFGNKSDGAQNVPANGKVVMDGAALTITNGAAIEVGTVEIKSGTVNVSGYMKQGVTNPTLWQGSTIFGKSQLTISGGTVNVFGGGLLAGDDTSSKLDFAGGETTIGNDGRVIGSGGTITLGKSDGSGHAVVNVNGGMVFAGTGAEAANPLIGYTTHPASIANGTITQYAGSTLNVGKGTGTVTDTNRIGRVYAKNYTMEGGTVNLSEGGRILADAGTFKAGTITIDGYQGTARSGIYDVAGQGATGKQTFGTAADSGPNVSITNGGGIESKEIEIKGGTFNVSGKADNISVSPAKPDWWKGSLIYAAEKLTMSGGTVNMGDYAQVTVDSSGSGDGLKITAGTVNLNGSSADKAAMLRACIDASTPGNSAEFEIGSGNTGTATVNVDGYGRMIGANVTVKAGGVVNVNEGGHLLVSNDRDAQYALPAFGTAALEVRDTKLTLDTGKVNVQGDVLINNTAAGGAAQLITKSGAELTVAGNMNFTTGTLDMSAGGSVYVRDTVTDTNLKTFATSGNLQGTLFVGKLVGGGSTGSLTVNSSDTTNVGFYGTGVEDQFYDGGSITVNAANSTLHLGGNSAAAAKFETKGGKFSGKVTVTDGAFAVNQGTWTVGGLDVASGKSADINGGTLILTDSLKSAADGDIDVNQGGTLQAGKAVLLTDAFASNAGNKIDVAGGAVLKITGYDKISLANAKKVAAALLNSGSSGMIQYDGATVTVDPATDINTTGSLAGTVKSTAVEGTSTLLQGYTVGYTATKTSGGTDTLTMGSGGSFGADALRVETATDATTLNITQSANLTLLGDAKGNLVSVTGATTSDVATNITVGNGLALNLGSAGVQGGGKLNGNVTLSDAASELNVTNGTFTVKDISGTAANADINIAGGALIAGEVGKTNALDLKISTGSLTASKAANLGAVELNGGVVKTTGANAAGNLTASTVTLGDNGGMLDASHDLTVTTLVSNDKTAILKAGNNVVLTNGAATTDSLLIQAGKDITATNQAISGGAGSVINAGTIHAAAVTLESGSLILTDTGATGSTLSGALTLGTAAADAALTAVTGNVAGKLTLSAGGSLLGGSSLKVNELVIASGQTVNVGSDVAGSTGKLSVTKLADGGTIFADPAWVAGTEYKTDYASQVAIADFATAGQLKTDIIGGQASQIVIGTSDTAWVKNKLDQVNAVHGANIWGPNAGQVSAALGITKAVTLNSSNKLVVDGAATNTSGTAGHATFGDNSLLIVDANGVGADKTALKASNISVGDNAKLMLTNVTVGKTYSVASATGGADTLVINDGSWDGSNLLTDHRLLKGVLANDGEDALVTINQRAAASVLPKLSAPMGGLIDAMIAQGHTSEDSPLAGVRFANRAINRLSGDSAAATIEGAAQMGAVAGVQVSTIGAANAASGAVTTRTSFAQPLMDMTKAVAVHQDADGALSLDTGLNAGNGMKNGLGVWIMPLYQSNHTWGQKAENFKSGISSDLGGIALGADYTVNDMFRFGAAFNVGGGYAQSSGDFNKTDNNFNFWGVNLYGGWTMNNFGLSADVGYTSNYNKVEQDMPAAMAMGNLKSDITSSAWSAGLKGEYKFETSMVDIIPHIGVRYMGLTTDSYDVKSGGTVFSVERDFQSIWTFPIGVAFSKTIESDSGWMFKPQVDLSVIPAAGDIKAKSKASIPGVMGDAEMKMQVVDYVTFDGGVGFEVGKDNVSFGLNYNIQASEHRTGHGVFGTLRYEF